MKEITKLLKRLDEQKLMGIESIRARSLLVNLVEELDRDLFSFRLSMLGEPIHPFESKGGTPVAYQLYRYNVIDANTLEDILFIVNESCKDYGHYSIEQCRKYLLKLKRIYTEINHTMDLVRK